MIAAAWALTSAAFAQSASAPAGLSLYARQAQISAATAGLETQAHAAATYAKPADVAAAIAGALVAYDTIAARQAADAATRALIPSTAGLATTAGLSALQSTVMAAMPQPATTTPSPEAVGGAVGAAATYMRSDAKMPRITRAGTATVGANGSLTASFTAVSGPPTVVFTPIDSAAATSLSCKPTALPTTTSFVARCSTDTGIKLTLSALTAAGVTGLALGPADTPAGTQVQWFVIPPAS